MELAARDISIKQSEKFNTQLGGSIIKKHKQLLKNQQDNEHLKDVVELYNNYADTIVAKKQLQYEALQGLIDYLRMISLDPTVTEEVVKHVNSDIAIILAEMKKL